MPRRTILALAVAGVLGGANLLNANPTPADTDLTLTPKYAAEEAAAPARPIMYGLDQIGLAKPLKDLGIDITGHVEGSYTYNFDDPDNDLNTLRVFDVEHNEVVFNQFDIAVDRAVDAKKLDVGGRMEWIYGSDAKFIHSNGLFDYHNDDASPPENQWDLNQLYGVVNFPVGNGLKVVFGKYVTPVGWELINPTGNWLYSHSFLFGYAIPFTHTGVFANYAINDNWVVEGGVFRGWDQWEDNNDMVSFQAKVGYTSTDKKWSATVNAVTGPEQADNDDDYRTVFDLILTCNAVDRWTFVINADYGFENEVPGIGDAVWYGVAGYANYVVNETLAATARAEWFRDQDGSRIGLDAHLYEITVGLQITPFAGHALGQNLVIRPEVRWDNASEDVFNGGEDNNQVTAAIEAYIKL